MKTFNWKRYLLYHSKWQAGFVITMPILYVCIDVMKLPTWVAIVTMQFIGAIIFYPIDRWIMRKNLTKETSHGKTEDTSTKSITSG